MVKSINIIHPEEYIQASNEYSKYQYNGRDWLKKTINIHRYIDKSIDDIDVSDMDGGDYI